MTKYRYEYRINKKGAECFRTELFNEAKAKLDELTAKRPGIYTMQYRSVQLNRVGAPLMDSTGRPLWTSWS